MRGNGRTLRITSIRHVADPLNLSELAFKHCLFPTLDRPESLPSSNRQMNIR